MKPVISGMVYLHVLLMLPLWSTSNGETPPTSAALNQTHRSARKGYQTETPSLPPPYLQLPVFVDSRLPLVEKTNFSPAKATRLEPLPEPIRDVLFPVRPNDTTTTETPSDVSVKTSCQAKEMHVRVDRSILGTGEALAQVKLGTCEASKNTTNYLYFEYGLGMCGIKRTISNNQVAYSTTLRYDTSPIKGLIRRAVPFTLTVTCYYNRYQYSYKIGYTPLFWRRNIAHPMKNKVDFTLTPRNAQWERLSPTDQYNLGKPMYFEAESLSVSLDERLYINLCHVTPEMSHTSTPQFPVVENFGCMVESKDNRSRFIPYKNNAVRFSVDAFSFEEITDQLYMHCSMSVGSSTPTPTAKSCNYDIQAKRWVELYGSDSVCTCCDSDCSSAASTAELKLP